MQSECGSDPSGDKCTRKRPRHRGVTRPPPRRRGIKSLPPSPHESSSQETPGRAVKMKESRRWQRPMTNRSSGFDKSTSLDANSRGANDRGSREGRRGATTWSLLDSISLITEPSPAIAASAREEGLLGYADFEVALIGGFIFSQTFTESQR